MSQMTSLDELHLINFDPSAVIANKEALIEYNRLKHVHNPKTEIITVSKEHYFKVKDIRWALSKVIASVKSNSDTRIQHSIVCVIHGFQNTDKISCYANTILQSLLYLNVIKQQLS